MEILLSQYPPQNQHIPFLKALFESMFFRTSRLAGYDFRSLFQVSIDHRASDADEEAENEKIAGGFFGELSEGLI